MTDLDSDFEPMVVFEFAVPAETFVLATALREFPDVVVECERLVPTNDEPMPYLWATGEDASRFREAMAADPLVRGVERVADFEEGSLYSLDWVSTEGDLLERLSTLHDGVSLLQAVGHGGEWTLKLRFPSRGHLESFRDFYEAQDFDLRVLRLYDLDDPKTGQYNITEKQREALVLALEMGYFEVPRDATLEDLAAALDISSRSVSERLRRGQTNLVSNSLTIGQLRGVGVDER